MSDIRDINRRNDRTQLAASRERINSPAIIQMSSGASLSGTKFALAKATADAGAAATMVCNIIQSDGEESVEGEPGYHVIVYAGICGGGYLNSAVPRIGSGDTLVVVKINGLYYYTTTFQASENCECVEP